ncbi:MAG: hypothetical protein PVF91_00085 [Chromatiales bacterium]|jgi:hypothetical protein
MARPPATDRQLDVVLLLGLFALLLFASPMTEWWAAPGKPWYLPYLFWALIIGLGGWLQRRRGD